MQCAVRQILLGSKSPIQMLNKCDITRCLKSTKIDQNRHIICKLPLHQGYIRSNMIFFTGPRTTDDNPPTLFNFLKLQDFCTETSKEKFWVAFPRRFQIRSIVFINKFLNWSRNRLIFRSVFFGCLFCRFLIIRVGENSELEEEVS